MAYRPHPKGASTNPSRPRAWGTCDRTGFVQNLSDMSFQYDWAGSQLINKGTLVRPRSLDKPQEQLRTQILPPDPAPILNARPEPYSIDEAGPVQTTLAVAANAGDITVSVASVSGFVIGNNVLVELNNATYAEQAILSLDVIANTMTFTTGLSFAAPLGGSVTIAIS